MNIEVHVPPLKQEVGQFIKPEPKKQSQKESQNESQQESQQESQKPNPKRALTREEADEQRYVTTIRWIVEVVFKSMLISSI